MNRTTGTILIAVFAALILFAIKYGYNQYRERQDIDRFAEAVLTRNPQVALDCPPLGKLNVTFFTESVPEEAIGENVPAIVKRWDAIWPQSYLALVKAANNYDSGKDLNVNPEVNVVLPTTSFSQNPDWKIEFSSKGGEYGVWFKGTTITKAKDDY